MSGPEAPAAEGSQVPAPAWEARVRLLDVGRRLLRVARIDDLAPGYRRIILAGGDLDDGFPFARFAASDHVKCFFPDPSDGRITMPKITEHGWELPEGAEPIHRDYTVRAWDAERHELTIEFVVHDHGVAGRWAARARPGDALGVLGPRGSVVLPSGYRSWIVFGDRTALPAMSRLAEEAPDAARIIMLPQIETAAQRLRISSAARLEMRWVELDTAGASADAPGALEAAVRAVELPEDLSELCVVGAGEAELMKPLRRYFRRELGLPKRQVLIDGYWRRGQSNLDHHAEPDEDEGVEEPSAPRG